MALDSTLHGQLLAAFQMDLAEQSGLLSDGLLALERADVSEATQTQAYQALLRAAHNVKGAARAVNLGGIEEVMHAMESLAQLMQKRQQRPPPRFIDLCLDAFDKFRQDVAAATQGQTASVDYAPLLARLEASLDPAGGAAPAPPSPPQPPLPAKPAPGPTPVLLTSEPTDPASTTQAEFIRVSVDKIGRSAALADELMVLHHGWRHQVRELAQLRQRLGQLEADLGTGLVGRLVANGPGGQPPAVADLCGALHGQAEQLYLRMQRSLGDHGRLLGTLRNDTRLMRLVPAGAALRALALVARSLARGVGKQALVRLEGEQVEVDRLVLERLQDPLTHLLRNAIDHGIEAPARRLTLGKPEAGTLAISIRRRGARVLLKVRDDGAGIDAQRIGEVALARHLVTAPELATLSPAKKMELIFLPGFSSRDEVSELSGRGVGLDVVHHALQNLQGQVTVESTPGLGTCFTLSLPLTLGTERGLVVAVGGRRLVIPTLSVERSLHFQPHEVRQVSGQPTLTIQGQAVLLRHLCDVLGLRHSPLPVPRQGLVAVVLGHGASRVALVVDRVEEEKEIVLKPLEPPLVRVRNVKGASFDDNGHVLVVLDDEQLTRNAVGAAAPALVSPAAQAPARVRILAVDDSLTTRTLVKSILEASGYEVVLCVDGAQALERLHADAAFDLVVTDIEMPQLDGFGLTQALKNTPALAHIPVIIVTSLEREDQRKRGMEVGADAYLVKSNFESRTLLETVRRMIPAAAQPLSTPAPHTGRPSA